jgi:putative oxidoreductase
LAKLVALIERVFGILSRNLWAPVLLARLAMADEFIASGWGHLHDLPKLTRYFESLGIPAAGANVVASATTELVGGILLLLGLGTRFAAIALTGVMIVAILTARIKEAQVHSLSEFFYLSEPCYILIFIWLIFQGGEKMSLDHLIRSRRRAAP